MKRLIGLLAALSLAGPAWAQDINFRAAGATGPTGPTGPSTDLTAPLSLGTAYGADMVTNGTFTGNATGWTLGGAGGAPDWAYSANTVTHADSGGTATLEPSTPLTVVSGRTYKVTFTLSAWTAGTVTASIGGASGSAAGANGTYIATLVATDTTNLKFTPTTTFVATIDTISVLESQAVTIANLTAGRIPFTATGGRLTDSTVLTIVDTGISNGVVAIRKNGSGSSSFLGVSGTLNTANAIGSFMNFPSTTGGTAVQVGLDVQLGAGAVTSSRTEGIEVANAVAGTGATLITTAIATVNAGIQAGATATTTGTNVGSVSYAYGGDISIGAFNHANTDKSNGTNIGTLSLASQTSGTPTVVAGYFGLRTTNVPTYISSVLQLDNVGVAVPLLVAQDNAAALPTTGPTATWQIMDGAWPQLGNGVLTSGTATAETQARMAGGLVHSCTWTNAQVVALGASLTGDISCFTLPAKQKVLNAYVVITGQGAGTATLTVALGRTSAAYIDYIVASDAKAAANTVYGDASGERGTNLVGYDLPSYTGTTAVNLHFISTSQNLDQVTGSTGRAIIETALEP